VDNPRGVLATIICTEEYYWWLKDWGTKPEDTGD